jgi:hypothetical protein
MKSPDRDLTGTLPSAEKRLDRAPFRCFALPKNHHKGSPNYFSYGFWKRNSRKFVEVDPKVPYLLLFCL